MSKFVKFEDLKNTRIITFDRPEKKNAFNEEMLLRMSEIIQDAEKNLQIRTIIITSKEIRCFLLDMISLPRV